MATGSGSLSIRCTGVQETIARQHRSCRLNTGGVRWERQRKTEVKRKVNGREERDRKKGRRKKERRSMWGGERGRVGYERDRTKKQKKRDICQTLNSERCSMFRFVFAPSGLRCALLCSVLHVRGYQEHFWEKAEACCVSGTETSTADASAIIHDKTPEWKSPSLLKNLCPVQPRSA